jgi:hypothetical protein
LLEADAESATSLAQMEDKRSHLQPRLAKVGKSGTILLLKMVSDAK